MITERQKIFVHGSNSALCGIPKHIPYSGDNLKAYIEGVEHGTRRMKERELKQFEERENKS